MISTSLVIIQQLNYLCTATPGIERVDFAGIVKADNSRTESLKLLSPYILLFLTSLS